ncbi:hypothetical protein [Nocardia arthritidis]|uniref:Subtilisin inhibitor domain-containing protein n=1 Tax=Nocardia arthritidis TaxID=228602 RepID=A0A6G9YNR6_9NOCA|nr:hypothetical protein [Nocardia arthritidis]QIS14770.1 hypothetical protein F5544_34685 [Nocardia arthritidis]
MVGRLVVRGSVIAALGVGSVVAFGPGNAVADAPCPDGTARIFVAGGHDDESTDTCQGPGSVTFSWPKAVSKVCAVGSAKAVVEISGAKPYAGTYELVNGHCAMFNYKKVDSATITVSRG